ncbi:MAG: hypothetical protein V8Q84_09695 [Bilophila sp.]
MPPSMRNALPRTRASATARRASASVRPKVCRETRMRSAARARGQPLHIGQPQGFQPFHRSAAFR